MGVYVVGTGIGARGAIALVDYITAGYGLGVRLVGGLSRTNTLVKLTGHGHRADLGTISTAGAALKVNVARLFLNGDLESPHITGYILHLREGEQFDIQMPADLDQLGRDNSHGAVVGGKGLVQLGHDPADSRALLQQIDLVA